VTRVVGGRVAPDLLNDLRRRKAGAASREDAQRDRQDCGVPMLVPEKTPRPVVVLADTKVPAKPLLWL
jgi:hypothetical protein